MSDDLTLAFAHPIDRARATAGAGQPDRISLADHVVSVEIGAFQAERGTSQRIRFNVVVEVVPRADPLADDVDAILSYDRITEAIAAELAAERFDLLETLAERVADRLLLTPQALRVFVRIEKLDRGPGALGVEIVRAPGARRPARTAAAAVPAPRPRVVHLSNAAIAAPHLAGWLDWLEAQPAPGLLCVGLPDTPRPRTGHPLTQRRVDLLAIEQNGWRLAARDPRCVVVDSRTEIDWGMRNGQTGLWAPARMVLDAVDGPSTPPEDSVALAAWFARTLSAVELLVIGDAPPPRAGADLGLPVRAVPADAPTLA